METQKVETFLMANGKFFPGTALPVVHQLLTETDDSNWIYLQGISFKDPIIMLIVSFIGGSLGIDRFLIGDTGLGIGKLLTCGGLGIWIIVDYFLIMDATKQNNLKKLQSFNSLPDGVYQKYKKKLYLFLLVACLAGYAWLGVSCRLMPVGEGITLCPVKRLYGIPCPACGSTRAVYELLQGHVKASFLINPNGMLLFFVLFFLPVWIAADLWLGKATLFNCWQKMEQRFTCKWIGLFFIILVLSNWIWNINKGL